MLRPLSWTESFRQSGRCQWSPYSTGTPHALAFLANVNQVKSRNLGAIHIRQSGDIDAVYRQYWVDVDSIIRSTLVLIQ